MALRLRLVLVVTVGILAQAGCGDKDLVTTRSGLRYKDLRVGEGKAAEAGDTVEVAYTGWLLDGKQFESNVGGAPLKFTIGKGEVIVGWDEGVVGMKVGGKRRLIIPSDLAYGPGGRPPAIPPGATLIFEVELLKIHESAKDDERQ
jgi:FKBP-type peptidyl-prolyl cis-trans isomerase